jgi:hypothetical protein
MGRGEISREGSGDVDVPRVSQGPPRHCQPPTWPCGPAGPADRVFGPTAGPARPAVPSLLQGPVSLDRRTESEAVVVEELAERMQAVCVCVGGGGPGGGAGARS